MLYCTSLLKKECGDYPPTIYGRQGTGAQRQIFPGTFVQFDPTLQTPGYAGISGLQAAKQTLLDDTNEARLITLVEFKFIKHCSWRSAITFGQTPTTLDLDKEATTKERTEFRLRECFVEWQTSRSNRLGFLGLVPGATAADAPALLANSSGTLFIRR